MEQSKFSLLQEIRYQLRTALAQLSWYTDALHWIVTPRQLPIPHVLKQKTIQNLQSLYNAKTLVETGTYLGDMVEAQRGRFKKIYSVELSEELARRAKNRFSAYPNVTILQGDSSEVLKTIVKKIKDRSIYWLDGHYSAGLTAKGELDCPVLAELTLIFSQKTKLLPVILIDDANCFVGKNDYPTLTELRKFVKKKGPHYSLSISNNIIHLLPQES